MTAPELLPPKRTNAAYTSFNLFDRVIAAASEGTEKDDVRVQAKVGDLQKAIDRRKQGLKRIN